MAQPIFRTNQIIYMLIHGCVQETILFATTIVNRPSMVESKIMCVTEKVIAITAGTNFIAIRVYV
jgi:hypothetical protein